MFMPGIVIVQEYFYRRRALAAGLSLCGSGSMGALSFAPPLSGQQTEYGWTGTYAIFGALILNGCACAMLFSPVTRRSSVPRVTAPE